mgnify:CR=1 FL=1
MTNPKDINKTIIIKSPNLICDDDFYVTMPIQNDDINYTYLCNIGNENFCCFNTGNNNFGCCNLGNNNLGLANNGLYNWGCCNSGDYNSGICNNGVRNIGLCRCGFKFY